MSTDDISTGEATDGAASATRGTGSADGGATLLESSVEACRQSTQRLRESLEPALRYFRERRPADVYADLVRLARERPEQTLAAAALLGAVVGGVLYSLSRQGR